ncbi:MAG: hypothetical protein V1709_08160 [Planctomycetota bacterium]
MPVNYRTINNKKYMWDGKIYENEGDALTTATAYKKDNFDVQLISAEGEPASGGQETGKYLLYTRRLATATTTSS